jgi:hypothetical protein
MTLVQDQGHSEKIDALPVEVSDPLTHASLRPIWRNINGMRGVLCRATQHTAVDASIRQRVQNGQFLHRLAQDALDLFVASHSD